ncbi:BofC C-terminal domain-containing protein [Paenibacillus hamazuiensis]|uniref:BofC C-terminal domain-containing protein n=1 Tax=Paenibacillus hamazuiensis TaxID=2936508 RepID=UPI00200E81D5|nr:BofC C-terminal domain-containing protein [Paenibacillus hamazuiensis]
MMFRGWLKQLKKKLRMRRRTLAFGLIVLLLCAVSAVVYRNGSVDWTSYDADRKDQSVFSHIQARQTPNESEEQLALIQQGKESRETFYKKSYVCGEEISSLGTMSPEEISNYYKEHPQLEVSLDASGKVYVVEKIDDLSPQCKDTAYFGLDDKGNLSLFNGVPGKENVIRTFFQLNISHLESSLPHDTVKQLYSGIRVKDLEEYNSVISTFSDYAVEETEKAMTEPHM